MAKTDPTPDTTPAESTAPPAAADEPGPTAALDETEARNYERAHANHRPPDMAAEE